MQRRAPSTLRTRGSSDAAACRKRLVRADSRCSRVICDHEALAAVAGSPLGPVSCAGLHTGASRRPLAGLKCAWAARLIGAGDNRPNEARKRQDGRTESKISDHVQQDASLRQAFRASKRFCWCTGPAPRTRVLVEHDTGRLRNKGWPGAPRRCMQSVETIGR